MESTSSPRSRSSSSSAGSSNPEFQFEFRKAEVISGETTEGEGEDEDEAFTHLLTPTSQLLWKYWEVLKIAKIELAIVLHMIAFKMFYLNLQNILLEQACRVNLNFSVEICDNLMKRNIDNLTLEEEDVQHYVAGIIRWKSIIDNFFPLIFVLFVGAWSDRYGRKLLILLPLFGYIAQTIGVLICISLPHNHIASSTNTIALVSAIPVALTGSIATLNMAIYSYIADITPLETRTVRTGVTNAAFLFGMSVGNGLGGILSGYSWGAMGTLGIAGALDVVAFIWILVLIRDPNKYQRQREERSTCGIFGDFFNLRNVLDAAKAVGRKREGNERLQIFLLIFAAYFFITVPEYGEESVYYLFLRYRLNWGGLEYGYYSTYRLLAGWAGGVLAVGILIVKLKFSDPLIGIICCTSHFSASFLYGFAKTSVVMCLGPIVGMWSSTMSLITKVIISKIALTSEIGKIYSFMGCLDAIVPLVANPLYTTVYKATFENILPGLFFFISAAMTIPPICVYTWLFVNYKRIISSNDTL